MAHWHPSLCPNWLVWTWSCCPGRCCLWVQCCWYNFKAKLELSCLPAILTLSLAVLLHLLSPSVPLDSSLKPAFWAGGLGGFSVTSIVLCCFGTFSTTWYLVPPKNCLEPLFHYVRSIRWQADCNMNSINSLIYMQNDSIDIVTFSKRWGGVIPSVNEPFKKDNNAAKSISCRQCTL